MSAKPLPIVPLNQWAVQTPATVFALLCDRKSGTTRDGKPYFTCQFRDLRRTVTAMIWADSPFFGKFDADWMPPGYFRINGVLLESDRYGLQLEIRDIREVNEKDRADGFDERLFHIRSRFDSRTLFDQLVTLLDAEITDLPVKQLTASLLKAHAERLLDLPASNRRYHPFPGGWIEHTLCVVRTCLSLTDFYRQHYSDQSPPLNRDLILAAAALHEIGRVAEWLPGEPGDTPEPSIPGRMHGHSLLARDLIREAARSVDGLNPEFLLLLEHCVMTHLSLPEWGSPRLPVIPEVLILHHADDLDAKLEMYLRCLANDTAPGPFTDRDPVLNKPLLKQRSI